MSDYLFDGDGRDGDHGEVGEVDPEVEALELLLGGLAHDRALRKPLPARASTRPRMQRRDRPVVWVVATVAVAACVALALLWPETPPPKLARLDDTMPELVEPALNPGEVPGDGPSGPSCMAFGSPEDPSGRLVVEVGHGCHLAQVGSGPAWVEVEAEVEAALECAYTFTVDEVGATHLKVHQGIVTLEGDGWLVWLPAGREVRWAPD